MFYHGIIYIANEGHHVRLLLIFSLAHARSTYLSQVIKAHNKIIYTVVTTLKTPIFTENNHNNQMKL